MAPKRETALQRWGREFSLAREAAGYTQEGLAQETHLSRSVIAKWETGERAPKDPRDLARCEEKMGTRELLKRLLKDWVSRETDPEWSDWMDVEEHATELTTVQLALVPGLLQTEDYARVVLPGENLVQQRMERQEILTREDAPFYEVLLSEAVLYNKVGNESIMADQLRHLIEMSRRDNVVIRIIRFTADVCARFQGPFVMATLDSGKQVAFVDGEIGGRIVERAEDLSKLNRQRARFSGEALSPQDSIDLIESIIKERWGDIT